MKWSFSAKQISQADHVQKSVKQNLAVGGALGTSLDKKMHKRAPWLSHNFFSDRRIDEEAVAAMQRVGPFACYENVQGN